MEIDNDNDDGLDFTEENQPKETKQIVENPNEEIEQEYNFNKKPSFRKGMPTKEEIQERMSKYKKAGSL